MLSVKQKYGIVKQNLNGYKISPWAFNCTSEWSVFQLIKVMYTLEGQRMKEREKTMACVCLRESP